MEELKWTGYGQAGEAACNSTHGANRLGANSTSECLVWGKITGMLADRVCLYTFEQIIRHT